MRTTWRGCLVARFIPTSPRLARRTRHNFDAPHLGSRRREDHAPITILWLIDPKLRECIEAAKLRRQTDSIRSTTFVVDDVGHRPWSSNRFLIARDDGRHGVQLAPRPQKFPVPTRNFTIPGPQHSLF